MDWKDVYQNASSNNNLNLIKEPQDNSADFTTGAMPSRDLSQYDIRKTPFIFFQATPDDFMKINANEEYRDIHSDKIPFTNTAASELSNMFFSNKNMHLLQKMLRKYVFDNTDERFMIEDQSPDALIGHMQFTFQHHSMNTPIDLPKQVMRLNYLLVDDVGPKVVSNVLQYEGYLRDKFSPLNPMDRPIYESSAGTRVLGNTYGKNAFG